jgi:CBS domain-containing protein
MKVGDIMKKEVTSVSVDDTLKDVKDKMVEKGVDFVVVKADGEIVGIITNTDILAYISAGKDLTKQQANKCMTACKLEGTNPCLQVFEDSSLDEAMKIMAVTGVNHLLCMG